MNREVMVRQGYVPTTCSLEDPVAGLGELL